MKIVIYNFESKKKRIYSALFTDHLTLLVFLRVLLVFFLPFLLFVLLFVVQDVDESVGVVQSSDDEVELLFIGFDEHTMPVVYNTGMGSASCTSQKQNRMQEKEASPVPEHKSRTHSPGREK